MIAVDVRTNGTRFEAGVPHELLRIPDAKDWAVTRDGQRFLAIVREKTEPAPYLTVMLNWDTALGGRR